MAYTNHYYFQFI